MAKVYYNKLAELVERLMFDEQTATLEVKHYFSGAALYLDDVICATVSPRGLAFKLDQSEVDELIAKGEAIPLKYFPQGNIKKGYALFQSPNLSELGEWRGYFEKSFVETRKSKTL